MSEQKPRETSVNLLGSGISSRLLEMRQKSLHLRADTVTSAPQRNNTNPSTSQAPELLLAQQLIDQRITEILSGLPAGKQRSLFKIRYGIDFDSLQQLPINRLIKLLKIQHPQFDRPTANMKRILELTYNGQAAQ